MKFIQDFSKKVVLRYIPVTLSVVMASIVVAGSVLSGEAPGGYFAFGSPDYNKSLADSLVLTASPNPIPVCDNSGVGVSTLSWTIASGTNIELRKDSQVGQLVYQGIGSGTFQALNTPDNSSYHLYSVTTATAYTWRYIRGQGWVRTPVTTTQRQLLGTTTITHTQQSCGSTSALVVSVNPDPANPYTTTMNAGESYVLTAKQGTQNYDGKLDFSSRRCELNNPTVCVLNSGPWGENALVNGSFTVSLPASFPPAYYNARFKPRDSNLPWSNEVVVRVNPPAQANRMPVGYIDIFDCSTIFGWAADPDTSNSINVQVVEGAATLATFGASAPRPDVETAGYPGNHGFNWPIPSSLKNGQAHSLRVFAIDSSNGSLRADLGARQLTCGSSGGGTTTSNININNIRSVTYWDSIGNPQRDRAKFLGCSSTYTSELEAQVSKMKAAGFNSVWLISWWYCFLQNGASPNMQFDAQGFVRLRETLDMLKRNNMKAELSLTYTAGIPGTNVSWCDILTYKDAQGNPIGYWTIRDYVTRFMTEIQNYNNDVVLLVHTEGLVCGTNVFATASPANAQLVRSTVGRLPWDLPSNLRQKFVIGFHDYLENISSNGTGEVSAATATMPKAADGGIPYDFKSMGYYDPTMYQMGNYSIYDLDERIQKLQDYYGQNLKVFMGELGSGLCYYSYNPQVAAMNLRSLVSHVIGKGRGINVWEWIGHDCSVVDSDFKLNDTNGNPLPTLNAVKSVLNP